MTKLIHLNGGAPQRISERMDDRAALTRVRESMATGEPVTVMVQTPTGDVEMVVNGSQVWSVMICDEPPKKRTRTTPTR